MDTMAEITVAVIAVVAVSTINPTTSAFQLVNTVVDDVLVEMMGTAPYIMIAALNIDHIQNNTEMRWEHTPWPGGVPLSVRQQHSVYPDTRKGVVHSLVDVLVAALVPRALGIDRHGAVTCDVVGVARDHLDAVLRTIAHQVSGLAAPATILQSLQTERCVATVNRMSIR